tara:strand:+ start:1958 stop:2299 length:342 start_codon:yes stop_codon:yes gene_type:complete
LGNVNGNGNGHSIIERLADFRDVLVKKYPTVEDVTINCAVDLTSMVINTFTVDTRARLKNVEIVIMQEITKLKQENKELNAKIDNIIMAAKYIGTVAATAIAGLSAVLIEKVL